MTRAQAAAASGIERPAVIARRGWGAEEEMRFLEGGSERFPPEFHPLRRVILHHTATRNDDPEPQVTIRAIYRHHTTVRGWGDIGYHFLLDAEGRIYEGRFSGSQDYWEQRDGEGTAGRIVTARHTRGANEGSMGVAVLGSYESRRIPTAARAALVQLLTWVCARHGIDPVAPSRGERGGISTHRDWVPDTACPGDGLYAELAGIRRDVLHLLERS